MDILLITDNKYIMPTGVLMYSIGHNNSESIHFHLIVDETFKKESREPLKKIAFKFSNDISFYVFTKELIEKFPFGRDNQPKQVSIATYYRLFAAEILPKDLHKVIYLDGDMIVRKSIRPLWDVDLQGYAIGVVNDQNEKRHCNSKRLPYPMENGYFNAGMLLINLDFWREHKCLDTFMQFVDENAELILWHDQDVLNSVFFDCKKNVPITYNFQDGFLFLPDRVEYNDSIVDEIKKYEYDPTIIHYTVVKPWKLSCFQPMCAAWRYYWRKTEWAEDKLDGEEAHNIKEWFRNVLIRYNVFIPKDRYRRIIIRK